MREIPPLSLEEALLKLAVTDREFGGIHAKYTCVTGTI